MDQGSLDQLVTAAVGRGNVAGAVLSVSTGDRRLNLVSSAGNLAADSRYYIASINKLFVSALILRLIAQDRLALDDRLADHVSDAVVDHLHVMDDTDYSRQITVRHLLSQTSGLPDYLGDKQRTGRVALRDLEAGLDPAWPLAKVLDEVKSMRPNFRPGQPGKARYGDTGHQILGLVLSEVAGRSVPQLLQDVFDELGMRDTHVVSDPGDASYVPVRYQAEELPLGRYLSSTGNDIISTAGDQMIFLQAFFAGRFWPRERLAELERWNRVFFPFEYGVGVQRFALPRALTLMRRVPPLIGHAGSVGSVAFYAPEKDVYFTGTVNQQAKPSAIYKPMIKVLSSVD